MATPSQIIANQQNAQSSTGPSTPEGKARVSQNAIKHGLTSKHLIIREDEQDEFAALQGAIETVTFHDLVHAAWNLHRLRRMEVECDLADFAASTPSAATRPARSAPTTRPSALSRPTASSAAPTYPRKNAKLSTPPSLAVART